MRRGLEEIRALTLRLVADLDDERARVQVHPGFSPLSWHLGHAAWQEEVWALRKAAGEKPIDPKLDGIFDSFCSEKPTRTVRLPGLAAIRSYAARVRERTLAFMERADPGSGEPLLRGGWVFRFLANHERQHAETMAAIRLLARLPVKDLPGPSAEADQGDSFLPVPGGTFVQGCDDDPDGWDNERPAHLVELAPFRIARDPVRNRSWLEFVEAGGYRDDRLWDPAGIAWRNAARIEAPLHWRRGADGAWERYGLSGWRPLRPGDPVSHVSWYEASAFARFAGARLPTESEWERAAAGSERDVSNLFLAEGDVCSCDHGPSACGARGMIGNVWEWTADDFLPYPGFVADPYRGYSAPWFGDLHKVLRGGSYLTHPAVARRAFRNWFEPSVREFPSGLRLAL